tara:strand:+ start:34 stop:354 length:321 start_codon:yes stop_codon:yes gene_type:complete
MKPILPTLKENKRYLSFRIISDETVDKLSCGDAINQACLRFLGELSCAKAGVAFLGETYKDKQGIIRVNTKYIDEVKVALASIQEINTQRATFDVVKVSGAIGKLK